MTLPIPLHEMTGAPSAERPILCGTDFLPPATEALNAAAAIARKLDVPLLLVHATGNSDSDECVAGAVGIAAGPGIRLAKEAERLRDRGVRVSIEVAAGAVDEIVLKFAREKNVQLIVIGAAPGPGSANFLFGGIPERIAERCPVPLLIARRASWLESWAGGEGQLNVLIGHDFSKSADNALGWVRILQRIGPCAFTAAYVDWPPEEMLRLGAVGPISLTENPIEVERVLKRELRERVQKVLSDEQVLLRVAPCWGRADARLAQIANEEPFDVVVMGTHQRRGFDRMRMGSVSRHLIRESKTNVVVVPKPSIPGEPRLNEVKRVLAPTDFSPLGNEAICHARASLWSGGTLRIIHVAPPWEAASPLAVLRDSDCADSEQYERRIEELRKKLIEAVPPCLEEEGIRVECEIVEGKVPARAIAEEAERFGADLICMGSHGRTGFSEFFLGSVAHGVMSSTRRPVLIVQQPKP
jgi:nucleotide-binding universal stress UspA family protein